MTGLKNMNKTNLVKIISLSLTCEFKHHSIVMYTMKNGYIRFQIC